jgi:MFS transporter, FHS family, glucose/mannose:H+ symporter
MNTPQSYPSRILIYLSFAATGMAMALPGAVLPALLQHCSMVDRQAGLLFFLGWMGSSIGALLVRPSRSRSIAIGALLTGLGATGMGFSTKTGGFVSMAVFGLGLGITMTATSLLQSARNEARRGAELNRLNLIWAIGASTCPTLAEHSLRVASARMIFCALGLFFFAVSFWAFVVERDPDRGARAVPVPLPWRKGWSLSLWPLPMVIIMLLPSGIESSMGGWIAAYIQRTHHVIATTVTAGTLFWIGLMLSRTLVSSIGALHRAERPVLRVSLCIVLAGALILIADSATLGALPGIFLVGFGLGPVYPLLLAIALQYSENTAIFFMAGLGSAFFPWLTGAVSSAAGSLRVGLLVPLGASALLLALGLRVSTYRVRSELAPQAH